DDAVEEALCFGWVDSLVQKIDEDQYAQKFTPRKNHSKWSEPNKKRARAMIKQGKMRQAGLAVIGEGGLETSQDSTANDSKRPRDKPIPEFIKRALDLNKKAAATFYNLAPSHRQRYVRWITSAKREETQKDRCKQVLSILAQDKNPGDTIPQFVEDALNANRKARTNFENLAPSYRRLYIRWIITARREETQKRRLAKAMRPIAHNKKLGQNGARRRRRSKRTAPIHETALESLMLFKTRGFVRDSR